MGEDLLWESELHGLWGQDHRVTGRVSSGGPYGCTPLQPLALTSGDRIQEETKDEEGKDIAFHTRFLDDGTFAGTKEQLTKVVDILLEEGPNRGLVLSVRRGEDTGKSVVWSEEWLDDYWDPLGRGIPGTE